MSDKEDDLGEKSRRSRKRGLGLGSPGSKSGLKDNVLDLSEDESSDEEITVSTKPSINYEKPSLEIPCDNPKSSAIGTSYDFSNIIKSQAELVEARDRFNTSVIKLESELDISPDEQLPTIDDKCTVEELLRVGEKDKVHYNNNFKPSSSGRVSPDVGFQNVEITLPSSFQDKEARRQKNKELALTKHLNQVRNERQKDMHKVHLLCLIAHGNFISGVINSEFLYGCALSFLPKEYTPPPLVTVSYILKLLKWFGCQFPHKKHKKTGAFSVERLEEVFTTFKPITVRDSVILFVSLLRGLSLTARIVINFNPVPLKVKKVGWTPRESSFLPPINPVQCNMPSEKKHRSKSSKEVGECSSVLFDQPGPSHKPSGSKSHVKSKSSEQLMSGKKGSKRSVKKSSSSATKRPTDQGEDKSEACSSKKSHHGKSSLESSKPGPSTMSPETSRTVPKVKSYKSSDKSKLKHVPSTASDELSCARVGAYTRSENVDKCLIMDSSSSEDEQVEETETTVKCGIDYWAEVYIENEERWVPVDLFSLKVDCVREIAVSKCFKLKNHPLYVLRRHLLKFEAIYPRDSAPLGYVRGEPVFSRFCVQTLFSREKWFRQGKSVKLDEIPYKLVNYHSRSGKFKDSDNKSMELFGSWQVVDYIPPPVVNGKVPVNDYGNVELYKPSMLPAGAVHIQVPGLMKIAQKLNIDCAHAVIGWQHHSGLSHPLIDGVVVAKEYQDVLLDAWNADVDFCENRYSMKRKVRAKMNWLKICKSLLIKEHLKKKYKFGEDESDEPLPKLPKKNK
nr:DNA repair protein complementing XP-C cells [Halyomorpha halys]